jgi:hypothetical protein
MNFHSRVLLQNFDLILQLLDFVCFVLVMTNKLFHLDFKVISAFLHIGKLLLELLNLCSIMFHRFYSFEGIVLITAFSFSSFLIYFTAT